MKSIPMKKALIIGITGQDGSYLAEYLLEKGYEVHGIIRRSSTFNTSRIAHLYRDPHLPETRLFLHYGDLTDATSLRSVISSVMPDEIYNLGAQSHVRVSFDMANYTMDTNSNGTLSILEAIREIEKLSKKKIKFYQASSSEMYGSSLPPQSEQTPFAPRSPYGVSKVAAYYLAINYRHSYGIFAVNGILFNHESPRRGETFVTRKITQAVARISLGLQDKIYLGNLDAKRDWGHAKDYVEAMHLMLQHHEPEDFVIATGEQHSVREFCELAFKAIGRTIKWTGAGTAEKGVDAKTGQTLIQIDPRYFRPAEVDSLLGDASKAHKALKWKPKTSFAALVREMVESDIEEARKELILAEHSPRKNEKKRK